MTRLRMLGKLTVAAIATFSIVACDSQEKEQALAADSDTPTMAADKVAAEPSQKAYEGTVAKPGSPYSISYRIVGTPIVGSPVVVDLEVISSFGPREVNLDYRINDTSSMMFSESQPASIEMKMAANESSVKQQVTVIPQREGRFYLNVSASYEAAGGTQSTVMAIPIQVGTSGRELQEHGTVELDENGEAVRVLSND